MYNKEKIRSLLSPTVYSLRFPDVRDFIEKDMQRYSELYLPNHDAPYEQTQPRLAQEFAEEYRRFLRVSGFDKWPILADHEFSATAGSSEAIRQVITETVINGGRIFCRPGEYEGYRAYTEAANGQYIELNHMQEKRVKEQNLTDKDLFIISFPSAIDGNHLNLEGVEASYSASELDLRYLESTEVKIAIDLAYIGVIRSLYGNTNAINKADYVFVTLSKVFGLYYHRIGGVFCKPGLTPKGLVGQKWFMNIDSLRLGTRLMQHFSHKGRERDYPKCSDHNILFRKYADAGSVALEVIEKSLGVKPVAASTNPDQPKSVNLLFGLFDAPIEGVIEKPRVEGLKEYRVCISPLIDYVLNKPLKDLIY